MPYKLRKAPKRDLYWVVSTETGMKHSKEPLPKARAEAQMRALYLAMRKEGGMCCSRTATSVAKDPYDTNFIELFGKTKEEKEYIKKVDNLGYDAIEWLHDNDKDIDKRVVEDMLLYVYDSNRAKTLLDNKALPSHFNWQEIYDTVTSPDWHYDDRGMGKVRGGTHRQNFLKAHKLEDKSYNLKELSKISAVPMMILQAVYDRGIGAYKTNPSSVRLKGSYVKGVNAPMSKKLSKEQWAMARVYSFLDGNPKHDNDLRGGAWYDIFRPSRVINEFVNPDSLARRRISDVFSGIRTNLPPSARRTMEEYGNEYIQSLMIRRDPIQSALNTVFEVITLGQWSKAKSAEQYDKLFHLGLVLTLASGKQILVEKNEVINIGKPKPLQPDSEVLELPPLPTPTTLNQFIANGAAVKGDDFYRYDPFANNCQDFVAILLKANNHYPPQAVKFVKQPVESLVKKLPQWTHPIARGITDLGAIANVALEGAGLSNKFKAQLMKAGLNPSVYLKKAQKKAKDAGYGKGAKLLGFATDGVHKLAMPNEDGKMIVFGRVGYGDHLIYSHLESAGKVPQGTASKKQSVFQKSHSQIRGDWKSNPFSPNNLALKILW